MFLGLVPFPSINFLLSLLQNPVCVSFRFNACGQNEPLELSNISSDCSPSHKLLFPGTITDFESLGDNTGPEL